MEIRRLRDSKFDEGGQCYYICLFLTFVLIFLTITNFRRLMEALSLTLGDTPLPKLQNQDGTQSNVTQSRLLIPMISGFWHLKFLMAVLSAMNR